MSAKTLPAEVLNETQAGVLLGNVQAATLRNWRSRGTGPAWHKLGGFVRYTRTDLAAFLASCRIEPGA